MLSPSSSFSFFFFNDTATTEIYTLSLHDALPISNPDHFLLELNRFSLLGKIHPGLSRPFPRLLALIAGMLQKSGILRGPDRKSTRLNSSHGYISYAVFCLKKKNKTNCDTVTCTHY